MTTSGHRRSRSAFAVLITALLGGACSSGSDRAGGDPVASDGPAATAGAEADATVPDPTDSLGDEAPPVTVQSAPAVDESCEFQSASMWGDELEEYFDALAEVTSVDSIEIEGELRLFVTDEVVQYIRDVDMVVQTDGELIEFHAIEGVTTGWELVEGVLQATDPVDRRAYRDVTIDGVEVEETEIDDLVAELFTPNPGDGLEFSCAGPTGSLPLGNTGERFTITLQPY